MGIKWRFFKKLLENKFKEYKKCCRIMHKEFKLFHANCSSHFIALISNNRKLLGRKYNVSLLRNTIRENLKKRQKKLLAYKIT